MAGRAPCPTMTAAGTANEEDVVIGLTEQEIREGLERELVQAMRSEGGVPTIHALAHSIARILHQDHLRIGEQLEHAGVPDERAPGNGGTSTRIVLGFDGSDHARRALQRAAELAGPATTVSVVAATPVLPLTAGRGPGYQPVDPEDEAERDRALEEARAFLAERGVPVEIVRAAGDAATAIVDTAGEVGADIVVVGTRGLTVAERLVLGSVSTRVIHHAPCDVLVVR